ncbi:hypothetical protein D3C85_1134570 [compost metagenome]
MQRPFKREWHNFNRQLERPQLVNDLAAIGHYDELITMKSDKLLTKKRSTAAFNQIQLRIKLISAINSDIELIHLGCIQ